MSWSFARSRRAADQVLAAPLGRAAVRAIRPASVLGIVRARAPLPLLLYLAARDGLVLEQDNGGFAVLQRPSVVPPLWSGGRWLRLLRWLDRRFDFVVFAGPPLLALAGAVPAAVVAPLRYLSLAAALAAIGWVLVFFCAMLVHQLRELAALGSATTPGRGRAAASLPAYHWSVPLVYQPEPHRVDELIRALTERLTALVRADLEAAARGTARVPHPEVTETLVVLTAGVCTEPARAAIAASLRAIQQQRGQDDGDGDVILLASPARLERVPRRPVVGGGFLLLYLFGLGVTLAICAVFVANTEARACAPASCAGRPVTYVLALRWLLQRLLFTDPPGLAPGTAQVAVFGWLVSLAAVMLVAVTFVAGRQEIARIRQTHEHHDAALATVTGTARVLILVVTAGERDAVLAAARRRVGKAPVADPAGTRTIHRLGTVAGTELLLAQAGEAGTGTAAGILVTARDAITQCQPDYLILTGICYGLRPEEGQQLGDVVIARRVHNIDSGKVTDEEVIQRGVNVGCSPLLLDRFQAGQVTWPGQSTWSGARVHIGTVLTANWVVNSYRLVTQLRTAFPDAIAGEMEGSGVYEAATLDPKPDWIMVKAISDWGYDKDDGTQPQAARNAAEYVLHVIAGGALPRRHGGPSTPGLG